MKRSTIGIALVLALVPACGGDPASRGGAGSAGTLVVAQQSGPDTLDPLRQRTARAQELLSLQLGLALLIQGGEGQGLRPWLAAELPRRESDRVVFRIRDEAVYDDGRPVLAADFRRGFEAARALGPRTGRLAQAYAGVSGIEDRERDIVVDFGPPSEAAIEAFGLYAAPLRESRDPEVVDESGAGCGPYRLEHRDAVEIRLARKHPWWGDRVAELRGLYRFDRQILRVMADEPMLLPALRAGTIDLCGLPGELSKGLTDATIGISRYYLPGFSFLGWNTRRPPFDRPELRRALSAVLPRDRIAQAAFAGLARPVDSLFGGEGTASGGNARVDLLAELAAAGIRDEDGDGRLDFEGKPLSLRLLLPAGDLRWAEAVATALGEGLDQLGIGFALDRQDIASMIPSLEAGRFDAFLLMWNVRETRPSFRELLHSGEIRPGGRNFTGLADPELDRLTEALGRDQMPDAREALQGRLDRRLRELRPLTLLLQQASVLAWRKDRLEPEIGPRGLFLPGTRPIRR